MSSILVYTVRGEVGRAGKNRGPACRYQSRNWPDVDGKSPSTKILDQRKTSWVGLSDQAGNRNTADAVTNEAWEHFISWIPELGHIVAFTLTGRNFIML